MDSRYECWVQANKPLSWFTALLSFSSLQYIKKKKTRWAYTSDLSAGCKFSMFAVLPPIKWIRMDLLVLCLPVSLPPSLPPALPSSFSSSLALPLLFLSPLPLSPSSLPTPLSLFPAPVHVGLEGETQKEKVIKENTFYTHSLLSCCFSGLLAVI